MPKIKNVSGEDRVVVLSSGERLVFADEEFEVEPGEVYGLTCQEANWAPADAGAKKAHKEAGVPVVDEVREGDL